MDSDDWDLNNRLNWEEILHDGNNNELNYEEIPQDDDNGFNWEEMLQDFDKLVNGDTSGNAESSNVTTNDLPTYCIEIGTGQNQNKMVHETIPIIENRNFTSQSPDNKNLSSNNGPSSSSSSSSTFSSSLLPEVQMTVWQTYCRENGLPIETEFMRNVENTQIPGRNKTKIDSAHPTLAQREHYATYQESNIYNSSKKLSDIHLKLICPAKCQTNPRTWFPKETIETLEPKRRTSVQRDRNYRLKRRIIENQLVYRAAYLENINETLKAKVDGMSTVMKNLGIQL